MAKIKMRHLQKGVARMVAR